jgi:ElaB/YqjD/DUF883 family membrane-anchored ribosome-binding protein
MSAAKTEKTAAADQDIVQDISAELEQIKKDIAALGETLGSYGKARVKAFPDLASDSAEETLESARQAIKEIRREARTLEQTMERRVSDHPMQSLLLAVGLGYLIAFLSRK